VSREKMVTLYGEKMEKMVTLYGKEKGTGTFIKS
jgi:hypothetical protein